MRTMRSQASIALVSRYIVAGKFCVVRASSRRVKTGKQMILVRIYENRMPFLH